MTAASPRSSPPVVILGAGYAGATVAHGVSNRGRGEFPVLLVDRHPSHVLRTELYEVGKIAANPSGSERWAVPIEKVLDGAAVTYRQGEARSIDLERKTITLDSGELSYGALVIALGSVAAYYGVPGADQFTYQVYRMAGAFALARAIRDLETRSSRLPEGDRPGIVVVGGGSTGTEVAAEIATTNWAKVVGAPVRAPRVQLVIGGAPFLAGLPDGLIHHARDLLARAQVETDEGHNVKEVQKDRLVLDNGTMIPFDLCVWCAGVQAPPIVRDLPVPHGHSGRIKVEPTLEVPGNPGVFAVGDVAEFEDPKTHMIVPATAQAALAEAPVVAANLVARLRGKTLRPFVYRERAVLVSVGVDRAAGRVGHLSIWGRPAALLKSLVEKDYSAARQRGHGPPGL